MIVRLPALAIGARSVHRAIKKRLSAVLKTPMQV